MITKADDYPIHQISKPVAETGTERNFYDRYFFNGYSKDEDIYFGAVLCVYPNLNIMDGSFTLAYEGKQYNSRVSRYLNLERLDTKVGPLSVEVIEPLNRLKVTLADVENDLDVSIENRTHEWCPSMIILLVNVCPRSQQGFGVFKMPLDTHLVECDIAILTLQG